MPADFQLPNPDVTKPLDPTDFFHKALANEFHERTLKIPYGLAAGLNWYVHRDYRFMFAVGSYDPIALSLAARLVDPGGVFFDVGSCIGYYSIALARHIGPRGQIHGFEPLQENLEIARRQLACNGFKNIHLNSYAVSDVSGPVQMRIYRQRSRGSLVKLDFENDSSPSTREVCSLRLDDYCRDHGWPDLVKIDVEGAAHLVLRCFDPPAPRPCLLIEFHDRTELHSAMNILSSRDFKVLALNGHSSRRLEFLPHEGLHIVACPSEGKKLKLAEKFVREIGTRFRGEPRKIHEALKSLLSTARSRGKKGMIENEKTPQH